MQGLREPNEEAGLKLLLSFFATEHRAGKSLFDLLGHTLGQCDQTLLGQFALSLLPVEDYFDPISCLVISFF
jgi:hypothetical protein